MGTPTSTPAGPVEAVALAAAASLLPFHDAILLHRARILRRYSVTDVHGLRAAGRRLRAGLRLFREEFKSTSATRLGDALRELLDTLGPTRDGDVFLELLQDTKAVGYVSAHPDWELYVAREERRLQRARLAATMQLDSEAWMNLSALLDAFFSQARDHPPAPEVWLDLLPRLSQRTSQLLRKLSAESRPYRQRSRAALHEFRRSCRRARYWVELLEPSLGKPASRMVKILTGLSESLGRVQDAEGGARRLARRRSWWAKPVRKRLVRQAAKAERRFEQRWRRARRDLADGIST
jgi:CHAD domain-containing protein